METLLFFFRLLLCLVFFIAIIPCLQKIYFSCYHPLLERDQKRYDLFISLLNLICVSSTFVFVYSVSGGGLAFFYKVMDPTSNLNGDIYVIGIFIGGVSFILARIWALYYNHSMLSTNFTLILLMIAISCVCYIYDETIFGQTFDNFRSTPHILQYCYLGIIGSIIISESTIKIIDTKFFNRIPVSYLLVRHQLESFETYSRLREKEPFLSQLQNALSKLSTKCDGTDEVFKIDWITTSARTDILELIKSAYKENMKKTIRIICEDEDEFRTRLETFKLSENRYANTNGNFRLIIVGRDIAFLGVQFGAERQTEFPDYTIIIKEPIRIASLRSTFESNWANSIK